MNPNLTPQMIFALGVAAGLMMATLITLACSFVNTYSVTITRRRYAPRPASRPASRY